MFGPLGEYQYHGTKLLNSSFCQGIIQVCSGAFLSQFVVGPHDADIH